MIWAKTASKYDLTEGEVETLTGLVDSGGIVVLRKLSQRVVDAGLRVLRTSSDLEEIWRVQGKISGAEALMKDIDQIAKDAKEERDEVDRR